MSISIFDLFAIGIGPSSSHTVGPMKAARAFVLLLQEEGRLAQTTRLQTEVFGSLAFTGKGHGTDLAILMGLEGETPEMVDPDTVKDRCQSIIEKQTLKLAGIQTVTFHYKNDFIYNFKDLLPTHTNGMRFTAFDEKGNELASNIYYSIGGGFILDEKHPPALDEQKLTYPFTNASSLIRLCETTRHSISELMLKNECTYRPEEEVKAGLLHIADTMRQCIDKGCQTEGILPGGLNVKRRASSLFAKLQTKGKPLSHQHIDSMEWLNLFAIAVNEENAAGGRIVTAPTNGAAGIIPAVLHYYLSFYPEASKDNAVTFLLTAGAIGVLYKKNASISGAEVGCQGEVGVACSMAAAGLTAVLGGDLYQIENAAEIAMEHHLGLTCDPINGLVQIPCIERNAMGAVKAVNAARLSLLGDGQHYVPLDKVIATMRQTGKDMMTIYKETSLGGLAANLPEC